MSSISGGGNYVSDGDIMQWLALQQDRIYGELRDTMDLAEGRASFCDELNKIKAELHDANSASPSNFTNVDAHLKELLDTYGSDPNYADFCSGLESIAGSLDARAQAQVAYAAALKEHDAKMDSLGQKMRSLGELGIAGMPAATNLIAGMATLEDQAPVRPPDHPYDDNQLKTWDELIGGKLDMVNRNDQLSMIHIQQLKSTIDQSSQFGSQFIASSDKTSSSIINNIA